MRTKYSKPQADSPWINDHVEIKTRRVGSVTRVYAKVVRGFDSIESGHRDFVSFREVLDLFTTIDDGLSSRGWTRR